MTAPQAALATQPMTGEQAGADQRLRAHLAYLKFPTAAEHLPAVLDAARAAQLSIIAALERLLEVLVRPRSPRSRTGG